MLRYAYINNIKVEIDTNWRFTRSINSQTSFSCTVLVNEFNVNIEKGNDIKFYDGINLIWAGIITSVSKYEPLYNQLYYDLEIASYEFILTRIKVSSVYENKTAGYIINDIVTNYLGDDDIIVGTIQDGNTFDRVVFNCLSVYECFNSICTANPGYNWCMNFDKEISFYQKETYKAETIINSSFVHKNFKFHDNLNEYRNVQFFEGGLKKTVEQVIYKPSPKPDGVARDFLVRYGIASQPTIYINTVAVDANDVGVNGIDTGKKWYWSYNSKTITQDTSETLLSITDLLEVTYFGLTQIKMLYEDNAKIQQRELAELNSSGRYEAYFSDNTIETNAAAAKYCKGLIEKYSDNQYVTMTIENDIGDIDLNKLVFIDKPLYSIYDWYLVESISIYYQNPEYISYDVKLLSGESVGNWIDYFKGLTKIQNTINSEDVLIKFIDLSENSEHGGIYIITSFDSLYPNDTLYPSDTLYPNYTLAGVLLDLKPQWSLYPKDDLYPGSIAGGTVLYD